MKQRCVLEIDVEVNETQLVALRRYLKEDVETEFVHPVGDEQEVVVRVHRNRPSERPAEVAAPVHEEPVVEPS